METERELLKCLVDFYSKLSSMDAKWKELSRDRESALGALRKQAEQLRLVTNSELDHVELYKVTDLRDRLIFKIHEGIEREVAHVRDVVFRLNDGSQDLKNRLLKLEATRSKLSLNKENLKELANGTPYRPKLNFLLEWAIDACNYYYNIYVRINNSLKALDYKDETSIDNLTDSFIEKKLSRMKIDRILAYTQFLTQESKI